MGFKSATILTVTLVFAVANHFRAPAIAAATPESTDVVIVGAGLSGLMTAYELNKRGVRTHILEARERLGGRVSTVDYGDGLLAEYGMQEIWANNPLIAVAEELGVELVPEYEECSHSSFMHAGEIYPTYDESMAEHWDRFLSPSERAGLEKWLVSAKALHGRATERGLADPEVLALQNMSFRDWVTSGSELSELARAWLRLHIEVELGSDWSALSALFALLEMEIFFDGGIACYSVEGGNSRLIDALAKSSGAVTLSAPVTNIRRPAHVGEPLRVSFIKDGRVGTIAAKHVVLAVPFYRIHQINIDPPLSAEHEHALGTLQRGQYVSVHLITEVEGAWLSGVDGKELPECILTDGPLGVIYGAVEWNDDKAVFSLLAYGEQARAFHMAPRAVKIRELLGQLDEIDPGFSSHVIDAYVYTYHPAAIAGWGPGRSPLDEHSELLRRPTEGLHFAGDYIFSAHSDGAVRSGMNVARQIAGERLASRPSRHTTALQTR